MTVSNYISNHTITKPGGTTAELAILVYINRILRGSRINDKTVELWDILLRFPEDDPVMLATSIKRLQTKGLLDDMIEIDIDLVNMIEQKHNIKVT